MFGFDELKIAEDVGAVGAVGDKGFKFKRIRKDGDVEEIPGLFGTGPWRRLPLRMNREINAANRIRIKEYG